MKIIVLDFSNNHVDIISTTQEFIDAFALSYYESEEIEREDFDLTDDFKIELFLSDHCQYSLDNCQWMADNENQVAYNFDLTERSFETDFAFEAQESVVTKQEFFKITSVSRDDLEGVGFDVSNVDDATMETLARKMSDDYCEQLFWTSMEIIAEDYCKIPKKNKQSNETD